MRNYCVAYIIHRIKFPPDLVYYMLDDILEAATSELLSREEARDEAYSRARRARTLSKQAILYLHSGNENQALSNLEEARQLLSEIEHYAENHPEIAHYNAVTSAKEEHSEASILYGLNTGEGYPLPEKLGVSATDYLLGLADVPGELRRQSLDHLRSGNLSAAEDNLEVMEEIYMNLVSIEEVSLFLKGLRRKLDIMRNVNERTRAEITTETSRKRLTRKLSKLSEKLD